MLRQGTIVRAWMAPPRGEIKYRPAVIYTPDDLIAAHDVVRIAGITTSYTPGEPSYIPLPWRSDGQIHTRLRRDCAVTLKLLASVAKEQLEPTGGFLRATDAAFLQLIARLKAMAEL